MNRMRLKLNLPALTLGVMCFLHLMAPSMQVFSASELTARELIEHSWQRYRAGVTSEREQTKVEVVYRGKTEQKELIRWVRYDPQYADKIAISFTRPERERIKALIYRRPGGKDEQWLKLPSLERPRRVSISDHASFAGTDLIYEDLRQLVGEQVSDFEYRLLNPVRDVNRNHSTVEAVPRTGVKSAYARRLIQIDDHYAVAEIRYYNQTGLLKTQTSRGITVDAQGRWRVSQIEIEHHQLSRRTRLSFVSRELNANIPENVFDHSFLTSERY